LTREFGYSATVGYAEREGYIDNTFQRRSADDRRSVAGRGALYWKPNPNLQLRFGVLAEKADDDASRLSSLFSPDPFVVSSDLNGVTQVDRQQYSFQARQKFSWGTVIATTSRQEWNLDPATTDLDLSPLPLAFSRVKQSEDAWTQEVRFESAAAADRPQWRAGVFYFDSEVDGDALRQFLVPPSQFVPPGFVQTEQTIFSIGQRNLAGYGNVDYSLTKQSMLKFGARVEHTESDLDRTKSSSNNFRFPAPQDPRLNVSQDHEYVSLTAGLTHSVSDSLSLVGRTSLGHKPEGYSAFTGNPQLARFSSEQNWANEIGVTFGPPKGRFGGSVLGFWNNIDRYQLERTVPNSTDFVVVNAKGVTSRGVEGKFMWNPVERVWWDFQAGYTDAKFDEHRDAAGTNVKGRRVPFIPKYTLRTGVTVALAKGLSANASYASIGRTYFDERNTTAFSQASYGIVNAQLRFRFDRWTATVYGHNVFDKNYYQFLNPEIFAGVPGAPRRFGVQVAFEY
jgi:iron complex outermembrane receptor protein